MIDKTPIIDLCLRYNEAVFATQSFTVIDGWVNDGCDIEQDIVPWLTEAMNKWKDITSLNWFRKGVYRNRDARRARELVQSRVDARRLPPDREVEYRKMQRIAWMRDRGIGQFGQYRHELEAYEQQHGRVEP